jgi:hypothetical protein
MLDFFVWGPTQRQGKIGWEAWTRTRIARVRVWSPTNWTTSQPRERRRKCSGQKAPATALQPFKNKTRELAASTGRDSGIAAHSCLHARNWGDIRAGKRPASDVKNAIRAMNIFLVWLVVFFAQGMLHTAHRSFAFHGNHSPCANVRDCDYCIFVTKIPEISPR